MIKLLKNKTEQLEVNGIVGKKYPVEEGYVRMEQDHMYELSQLVEYGMAKEIKEKPVNFEIPLLSGVMKPMRRNTYEDWAENNKIEKKFSLKKLKKSKGL